MMCFLQRFYDERLAEDSSFAWNGWLQAIALLGLRPLVPLAEAAFQEGRIGPNLTDRSYFEADLARAEREPDDPGRFKDDNLDYIDDVLGALQRVYRLGEPSGELGPPRQSRSSPPPGTLAESSRVQGIIGLEKIWSRRNGFEPSPPYAARAILNHRAMPAPPDAEASAFGHLLAGDS
jgi:hypothetical protein